ncbi:sugar nucleotide-binding protein [Galbibacter pacificus]|uniref:dTDP-4-dehydrorhamnose reductase n=1 Tax=Galbibacter pacificus TaxID=2996052 RepID=A0ABT6FUD4_9FLAO|nr:sugar nucleotide-binding protein [Galbibacter pacificus]MDG3583663.1 sugar nucleotide-binding protein [Galbibacter pacificus]MDG3586861.1 sugar nucleotide-binding protein [Galbibacter pacificus]
MKKILILGASGFIGGAIYKELCAYYDTYGTYHTGKIYSNNKHFFRFDMENDDLIDIVTKVRPNVIISALRGDFEAQIDTHQDIADYCRASNSKVIFLSSANVFDAFSNFPSYEFDKTLSMSTYGKFKIKIETALMQLPEKNYTIVRLPMVFGSHSPRIKELKYFIDKKEAYEVFPDLVMNVAYADKLSQQIHYIVNRNRKGIYHLGSSDLIHHDEFIKEAIEALGYEKPLLKNVYTSNFDRFLAVLPKDNKLPKHLNFSHFDVINELKVK